jgi:hypothetical protein
MLQFLNFAEASALSGVASIAALAEALHGDSVTKPG